ncbi:hypothetical protein INT48_006072, partial [Thamnidium elegans]
NSAISRLGVDVSTITTANHLPRGPLSLQEKTRRRNLNLCLYCGNSGHFTSSCPNKRNPPARDVVSTILLNDQDLSVVSFKNYAINSLTRIVPKEHINLVTSIKKSKDQVHIKTYAQHFSFLVNSFAGAIGEGNFKADDVEKAKTLAYEFEAVHTHSDIPIRSIDCIAALSDHDVMEAVYSTFLENGLTAEHACTFYTALMAEEKSDIKNIIQHAQAAKINNFVPEPRRLFHAKINAKAGYDIVVCDFGGNVVVYTLKGTVNRHCCSPIMGLDDAHRWDKRDDMIFNIISEAQEGIEKLEAPDIGISIHSSYDIPMKDWPSIMIAHGTTRVYGVMHYDDSVLDNDSGDWDEIEYYDANVLS